MYRPILSKLGKSSLLRWHILALYLSTSLDWILMPIVAKLEGMYLPIFMISFFMLLSSMDGLIQPLFKKAKLHQIYYFSALLDFLQVLCYGLYFVDRVVFTYTILTLFTIQAITFEISRIHTIDFMQEILELKDYLILRSMFVSLAVISGSVLAMGYDLMIAQLDWLFYLLALLGILSSILLFYIGSWIKRLWLKEQLVYEKHKGAFRQ